VVILVPKGRIRTNVPESLFVIECGRDFGNPIKSILYNGPALLRNLPDVDLVLSTMPYMAFLNTVATWLRPTRGIHFIMADDYHLFDDRTLLKTWWQLGLHKMSVWLSYRLPLVMVANSVWTRDRVSRIGPKPEYIINPGINPEVFKPNVQEPGQADVFQLATVARKHAAKGWGELVEGLNLLWQERQDFQLTAITADSISVDACKFPVSIVTPEGDEELVKQLQAAHLFIFPSRMEGFGLPPLEAMACGVPVVSTDIDGIKEYAQHDVNAWLVPVNSPVEMSAGVRHLFDNPEVRMRLRAEGLKTAAQYSWKAFVDKLEPLMEPSSGK
jgi:glycosyltransferase involved in cell wall biosynthesis